MDKKEELLRELEEHLPEDTDTEKILSIFLDKLVTSERDMRMEAHRFQGPLPPPSILKQYQEVQDDLPERVIHMAEKEQDTRLSIHRETVETEQQEISDRTNLQKRGQWFAFVIAFVGFILGGVLFYWDMPGYGLTIIIVEILSLSGAFLYYSFRMSGRENEA